MTVHKAESIGLGVIVTAIALAAGASSFTHVHDWTVDNGQPDWIGWANATGLELLSIAAALEIRARRRRHAPIGFAVFVMVCAIVVSLFAQVSEAHPGIPANAASGYGVAALPLLMFLALFKMLLGRLPAPRTAARPPVPVQAGSVSATIGEPLRLQAVPVPTYVPVHDSDQQIAGTVGCGQTGTSTKGGTTRPGTGLVRAAGTGTRQDTAGSKNGSKGGTATKTDSGAKARMRTLWEAERAAGRTPTGAQLARAGGCADDGYGRRLRRQWLADEQDHQVAGNGAELDSAAAQKAGELVAV